MTLADVFSLGYRVAIYLNKPFSASLFFTFVFSMTGFEPRTSGVEATALPQPQPLLPQGKFTLLLYVSISDGHILIF